MSYKDQFTDEPNYTQGYDDAPEANTLPSEAGFYKILIPEHIRRKVDGTPPPKSRTEYNGIAHVYGTAPFFKIKIWDFMAHSTSFGNAPHLLKFGPKIAEPEDQSFNY